MWFLLFLDAVRSHVGFAEYASDASGCLLSRLLGVSTMHKHQSSASDVDNYIGRCVWTASCHLYFETQGKFLVFTLMDRVTKWGGGKREEAKRMIKTQCRGLFTNIIKIDSGSTSAG